MGREIRRVVPNWEHPKQTKWNPFKMVEEESFQPLFDEPYAPAMAEWIENHQQWELGLHEDQLKYGYTKADIPHYADYGGDPPDVSFYRPDWKPEEATWFQVYETVSEGTPVTPPFATREELVEYLVANGDFWDQQRRADKHNRGDFAMPCDPWKRENAERFVFETGYAPSLVSQGGVVMSGVEALTELK